MRDVNILRYALFVYKGVFGSMEGQALVEGRGRERGYFNSYHIWLRGGEIPPFFFVSGWERKDFKMNVLLLPLCLNYNFEFQNMRKDIFLM